MKDPRTSLWLELCRAILEDRPFSRVRLPEDFL